MKEMILDDFIKYVKEQFDCDISVKMSDAPDTFERIFGASFLNGDEVIENVNAFENELSYQNICSEVHFELENDLSLAYNDLELAA